MLHTSQEDAEACEFQLQGLDSDKEAECYTKLRKRLLEAWPGHLPLLQERVQRLGKAKDKQRTPEESAEFWEASWQARHLAPTLLAHMLSCLTVAKRPALLWTILPSPAERPRASNSLVDHMLCPLVTRYAHERYHCLHVRPALRHWLQHMSQAAVATSEELL